MLLRAPTLSAIAAGRVDLAFRRWSRPLVRAGGSQLTAVGVLAFDRVEKQSMASITDRDARRAGFGSRRELLSELRKTARGQVFRIELRLAGPDPRSALRRKAARGGELREILQRLAEIDSRSRAGAWTGDFLRLIADRPGTRAPDLAKTVGMETRSFKTRVRRLKGLGLTESLEVGYRLSPRGRSVLERLDA